MADSIEHNGIVVSIDDDTHITVRIIQVSACATCSIKGHCTSSDSKEKLISISDCNASDFKLGDQVYVTGTATMGMQAVLLAFVIPFLLTFITLSLTMSISDNEGLSAILGLVILVPYYVLLNKKKNLLKKKFLFTVEHLN